MTKPQLQKKLKKALLKTTMGNFYPRGKRIIILGGGDTAQDVKRWIAKYLEDQKGMITTTSQGPNPQLRYLSKENMLTIAKMDHINAKTRELTKCQE